MSMESEQYKQAYREMIEINKSLTNVIRSINEFKSATRGFVRVNNSYDFSGELNSIRDTVISKKSEISGILRKIIQEQLEAIMRERS